ncbi:MAG: hypothetical protein WA634_13275 [Silvibacterium sp.]
MALKIGSEDKKKVAIAAVLAVVVLIAAVWAGMQVLPMFGGGTPPAPMPPKIARTLAAPGTQTQTQETGSEHEAEQVPGSIMNLDPTLHPEWMAAAESLKYTGTGRNIFSMSSTPVVIEKPQGAIRPNAHKVEVAQGPPPPPAIDLKFFGYEAHAGGARKVFLLHDDDVFIASAGDVVDHRYKILTIAPLSIQVQDIPYNDTQTLPLIQN